MQRGKAKLRCDGAKGQTGAQTGAQTKPSAADPGGQKPPRLEWDPFGSYFGIVTYAWVTPLIMLGLRKTLQPEDLPRVLHDDSAEDLNRRLTNAWNAEKAASMRPRYWRALLRSQPFWHIAFLLASGGGKISSAIVLGLIIDFFRDANDEADRDDVDYGYGCLLALVMVGTVMVGMVGQHMYFFFGWRRGMQMRIASKTLIYDRILSMRACNLSNTTTGRVVNLASNDIERFALATMFFPYLIFGPLESLVVLVILWFELELGALAGFALLLGGFLPLQFWFSKKYAKLRLKAAQYTDQRVKLMSEVISGARVMKCYAWEHAFASRVSNIRQKEIKQIKRTAALRGLNEGLYFACPAVVGLLMFGVYIATGNTLTARKVFVSFTLILVVQLDMTKFFAYGVKEGSEAVVAAGRISDFLLRTEMSDKRRNCQKRGNDGVAADDYDEDDRNENLGSGKSKGGDALELSKRGSNTSNRGSDASLIHTLSSRANRKTMSTASLSVTGHTRKADSKAGLLPFPPSSRSVGSVLDIIRQVAASDSDAALAIQVENLTATWTTGDCSGLHAWKSKPGVGETVSDEKTEGGEFSLRDVSLRVRRGGLVVIGGVVGHGKTSLLMALAGELNVVKGVVALRGKAGQEWIKGEAGEVLKGGGVRLAFVGQDPWVVSASIRENILFGMPFDPNRYEAVLTACALHTDLKRLDKGDLTMVGERGVTLSGGQRARVALARAAYSEASIVLLDDPLSAVDPEVARQLFDNCIYGPVMRDKTRVLVTHQLHYAKGCADQVLYIERGRLSTKKGAANLCEMETIAPGTVTQDDLKTPIAEAESKEILDESGVGGRDQKRDGYKGQEDEKREEGEEGGQAKEDREVGNVKMRTFTSYLLAAGSIPFLFLLGSFVVLGQGVLLAMSWYFGTWAQVDREDQASLLYVMVGVGLGITCLIWASLRAVWALVAFVGASERLHNTMFDKVVRLPTRFFDTNPSGRVLNRFSKDTGFADDLMPSTFFDFTAIMLRVLGVVLLVCIINPVLFVAVVPLVASFLVLQRRYLITSREVKRLEAISRSPTYSQISETLAGMIVIRAFGEQARFREEFSRKINMNVEAFFAYIGCARWLGIRLDFLTLLFTICVLYAAILMQWAGFTISESLVGLSLAYLVQLGDAFQWCIRQLAEFENQLVSVERMVSYINLDPEAPLMKPLKDGKVPSSWPNTGEIVFQDFSARYAPSLPLVLRKLQCRIPGGAKVALVGRTGAGKSSIIQCLFRLVEAADETSKLIIDGVDVRSLGLHKLRKAISVIPQSPWLFAGTVKQNLDPFGQHTEEQIWSALGDVQLSAMFKSLHDSISEAGSNLSAGQKQLMCLARAILRHNQILICDEATANVDLETDKIIQKTIRSKFQGKTVIMIAHRLHTIIDVDLVLVLNRGELVESGHPHELLREASNRRWFAGMVDEMGDETAKALRAAAEKAWTEYQRRCGDQQRLI